MSNTPGIGGGNGIGYQKLFNDDGSGKSLNTIISERFKDVQDCLAKVQADPGNPAALMQLQVAMNSLQQIMSSTTQLINSLKSMTEGINRNI